MMILKLMMLVIMMMMMIMIMIMTVNFTLCLKMINVIYLRGSLAYVLRLLFWVTKFLIRRTFSHLSVKFRKVFISTIKKGENFEEGHLG